MKTKTTANSAFTLVEMLVVLGIIVLLISLLLPMIGSARRSAESTRCLGQLRELAIAVQQYSYDNDGVLPDASSSNSIDSPYSPRGLAAAGMSDYHAWDPIPKGGGGGGQAPGALGENPYCMPSIGQVLLKYLGGNGRIWKCPSQASARTGGALMEGKFVFRTAEEGGYDAQKQGPMSGNKDGDEFRPGYRYMSTKELHPFLNGFGSGSSKTLPPAFPADRMVVLNVAGLPTARFKTLASRVVLFTDYLPSYHSVTEGSLFDPSTMPRTSSGSSSSARNATPDYQANFAYLDGHAETRKFSNLDEYLTQFGPGFRETYWGRTYMPLAQ